MTISSAGVVLIKSLEGFSAKAYPDFGANSIGWGHRSKTIPTGMTITEAQAQEYLDSDIGICQLIINRVVKVQLTQNQYDALVSFVFNTGKVGPTMLRKLNAGDMAGASAEFPKWINAGGKPHPGLVKRRAAERALFDS